MKTNQLKGSSKVSSKTVASKKTKLSESSLGQPQQELLFDPNTDNRQSLTGITLVDEDKDISVNSQDSLILQNIKVSGVTNSILPNSSSNKPEIKDTLLSEDKLTGVTHSLSGVTITGVTKQHNTMASKGVNTNDNGNSKLKALARLETRLLENSEKDLNNMEQRLATGMRTIVDTSIQEALKNMPITNRKFQANLQGTS